MHMIRPVVIALLILPAWSALAGEVRIQSFPVPDDAHPHDVAPAPDGTVWYTAQHQGALGRLEPESGEIRVHQALRGYGPYGIHHTPDGEVWYASLAASYIGRIEGASGEVHVVDPPTDDAGTRRVWSDSKGRLWVSEWNAGQLALYDPVTGEWREWPLPGDNPAAYAVYVDERDMVWLSDFGANAVLRFDPESETFKSFPIPRSGAAVRQMLGRKGEVWAAESGTDHLTVYRYD